MDFADVFHSKWLNCNKVTLIACGYANCWRNQSLDRLLHLSKNVKNYYTDLFIDEWKIQIHNSPKCLNYRVYKTEFEFEKYFCTLPVDLMYTFCKFRCGTHRLPIESGRFFSIERSERICDLCNLGELGDEFHYLFSCDYFKQERYKFLPHDLCKNKNIISFSELMNSQDKYVLIGLSKFCKIAMPIFKL